MGDSDSLLTYSDVLKNLENSASNHLLLGNGFNNALGIKTGYKDIFDKMIENDSSYKKIKWDDDERNIEYLIGKLKDSVQGDFKDFKKDFLSHKVRLDFMKATNDIVREKMHEIHGNQKLKGDLCILFKGFQSFFTLNFDPALYLILMQFKRNDRILVVGKNERIVDKSEYTKVEKEIFDEVQKMYENGEVRYYENEEKKFTLKTDNMPKTNFEALMLGRFKGKITGKKLKEIITDFLNSIKKCNGISLSDGFLGGEYSHDTDMFIKESEKLKQNLFYLHGAFHIYKEKNKIKKIVKSFDSLSFTDELAKVINSESKEIITVFQRENKLDEIKENDYLIEAHRELSKLKGNLVVIGWALDENDKHMVDQINESEIGAIYYAGSKKEYETQQEKLKKHFPSKKCFLFDRDTTGVKA